MAKKITLIILTSFLFSFLGYSQNNKTSLGAEEYETATVITYNLTFYIETSSFCNGTNNDANLKDAALAKIVDFAKPDVMVCQEIGSNFTNPNKII